MCELKSAVVLKLDQVPDPSRGPCSNQNLTHRGQRLPACRKHCFSNTSLTCKSCQSLILSWKRLSHPQDHKLLARMESFREFIL